MYRKCFYDALKNISCDKGCLYEESISRIIDCLLSTRTNRNVLYFIGNGGSAGIAMHMTTDFLKNGHIKTHSMHDPAMLTCLGNDYGYEYVFSKQLEILAEEGDVLVAISSSGNSPNIINAANVAREKGCYIVTLSGFKPDNRLRQMGNVNIYVSSMEYGIVESVHNMILQQVVDEIMAKDREEATE